MDVPSAFWLEDAKNGTWETPAFNLRSGPFAGMDEEVGLVRLDVEFLCGEERDPGVGPVRMWDG